MTGSSMLKMYKEYLQLQEFIEDDSYLYDK